MAPTAFEYPPSTSRAMNSTQKSLFGISVTADMDIFALATKAVRFFRQLLAGTRELPVTAEVLISERYLLPTKLR